MPVGPKVPLRNPLIAAAAALCLASGVPQALAATVNGPVRATTDRGALDLGAAPVDQPRSITIALKIPNRAALEAFVASTTDPSSPNFRKFLTPAQFAATYGQSPAAVARVTAYLQSHGIGVTKVFKNNLLITAKATNAQLATAFGSPIHKFSLNNQTFQRPVTAVGVPAVLQDVVSVVAGLSTQAILKPHFRSLPKGLVSSKLAVKPKDRNPSCSTFQCFPTPAYPATEMPQFYTTADVAEQYNAGPVYQRGITGFGTTIAVLSLAGMDDAAAAYQYWSDMGLKVARARITEVPVDGGPGSDFSGEIETTLDVEQAGGLAPQARLLVYEAPNTAGGWIDLFAQAVEDNQADLMTTSWGGPEIFQDSEVIAAHEASLLQAAAQGIPVIAAAGDSGAYDVNGSNVYPGCTATLTVDYPASSPYVTAAGGTTRPVVLDQGTLNGREIFVTVPAERPWAWDYLFRMNVEIFGQSEYFEQAFPVGAGGGVNVLKAMPAYQAGLAGTKTSAAGQSFMCRNGNRMDDFADLPVGFAGRNVPDVSLNADPATGFLVYLADGLVGSGNGGTSFVAPQLAGIFALATQQAGTRLGFLNPQIYSTFKRFGYGAGSPFNAVTSGDNEFYKATNPASYNPASGIGTLNIDNLVKSFATP